MEVKQIQLKHQQNKLSTDMSLDTKKKQTKKFQGLIESLGQEKSGLLLAVEKETQYLDDLKNNRVKLRDEERHEQLMKETQQQIEQQEEELKAIEHKMQNLSTEKKQAEKQFSLLVKELSAIRESISGMELELLYKTKNYLTKMVKNLQERVTSDELKPLLALYLQKLENAKVKKVDKTKVKQLSRTASLLSNGTSSSSSSSSSSAPDSSSMDELKLQAQLAQERSEYETKITQLKTKIELAKGNSANNSSENDSDDVKGDQDEDEEAQLSQLPEIQALKQEIEKLYQHQKDGSRQTEEYEIEEKEHQQLLAKQQEISAKSQTVLQDNENLENSIRQLQQQIEETNHELASIQEQNAAKDQVLVEYLTEIENLKQQQQERNNNSNTNEDSSHEFLRVKNELDAVIKSNEDKIRELDREIAAIREETNTKRTAVSSLKRETHKLSEQKQILVEACSVFLVHYSAVAAAVQQQQHKKKKDDSKTDKKEAEDLAKKKSEEILSELFEKGDVSVIKPFLLSLPDSSGSSFSSSSVSSPPSLSSSKTLSPEQKVCLSLLSACLPRPSCSHPVFLLSFFSVCLSLPFSLFLSRSMLP
jgi:hypothetical protein